MTDFHQTCIDMDLALAEHEDALRETSRLVRELTESLRTLPPPRLDGTHAIIPCRLTDGRAAELEFSAQLHHETPDPHVGWPGGWELESVELEAVRVGGIEMHRDTWNRLIPRDADERASEFFDERIDEILPEGDGAPDGDPLIAEGPDLAAAIMAALEKING